MTLNYGKTIHLPKTSFPRRAGLSVKEPLLQKRWNKMGLYQKQRDQAAGKEKFILHAGPPFANGHIHIGHAMTFVLKDVINRSYQLRGFDAPMVTGFDCHGLPIEWKVEENYLAEGKKKDDVDPVEFRTACRKFASKWVKVQTKEFQRLGIVADWDKPYLTMLKKAESLIASEIHKFVGNKSLYRGSKPIMWSVPEKTALAEAEIEYKDVTSTTAWVKFPIKSGKDELVGANIVIWTTTPWTLPANRAVAYGANYDYIGLEVKSVGDETLATVGDKLLIGRDLLESFKADAKINEVAIFWEGLGSDLEGVVCNHPLYKHGYDFDVRALPADFVTTDAGTGFVHIAPGHGEDDYLLGLEHGVQIPQTVAGDGTYFEDVPLFAGIAVYTDEGKKGPANKMVLAKMIEEGALVAKGQVQHSYPHSWRSKSPVIFRNTPQWFISMDKTGLRAKALEEIKNVRWIPERTEKRISTMVEGRGDWCISRQRAWGVPIALFVNKETGEVLEDQDVMKRIIDIFEVEGSDAWLDKPASEFLGDKYKEDDYEQVQDIIDVWFESGSTQGFVLEDREELQRPADLYLEGSDQHRGWFQSSLLVGCGTRGNAPYKSVLTHGFTLDEKGYKMSKSIGNVISPLDLASEYGADIIRLWAIGADYTEDVRIGDAVIKGNVDIYRRIRNTFCYLLGSLSDFNPETNAVAISEMSDFDRYILNRLFEMNELIEDCVKNYEFQKMLTALHNFCAKDLSAFYFDVNKDNLYCNLVDGEDRRATQTVLNHVFYYLCHWFAPILSFTTEEAWLSKNNVEMTDMETSIHLSVIEATPSEWEDKELSEKWGKIFETRRVVTGAIELQRAEKIIRSSLEAKPVIYLKDEALKTLLEENLFHDVCITSGMDFVIGDAPADAYKLDDIPDIAVVIEKANGDKCERCWKYTDDVGSDSNHPEICHRCANAVVTEGFEQAA